MTLPEKQQLMQERLIEHYHNDVEAVKRFVTTMDNFGINIGDESVIDAVIEFPHSLAQLISLDRFGTLAPVGRAITDLKLRSEQKK